MTHLISHGRIFLGRIKDMDQSTQRAVCIKIRRPIFWVSKSGFRSACYTVQNWAVLLLSNGVSCSADQTQTFCLECEKCSRKSGGRKKALHILSIAALHLLLLPYEWELLPLNHTYSHVTRPLAQILLNVTAHYLKFYKMSHLSIYIVYKFLKSQNSNKMRHFFRNFKHCALDL